MKKVIFILLLLLAAVVLMSQPQEVAEGKSVVYFVRATSFGALINFTYFDGEKVIGRFNGPKYMRYECEPGEHLFWARSENKSFVEADLEAGRIYILDATVKMGGLKAAVELVPVDTKNYNMKRIQKLLAKKDPERFSGGELYSLQEEMKGVIERGMEKYALLKQEGRPVYKLNREMYAEPSDLIYQKKKKR
jgi:hypothetical protein